MFDFLDKVRMAAALCHPMIVPILEIGVRGNNAGYAMIVMKHIEGRTLADASRRTPLPIPKAVSLVAQIARAVDYAHGQGCLHLNLKPSNILLDSRGHALIADFGFGPDIRGLNSAFVGSRGTPPYMAPELVQRDFRAIDRKTDVWALAIMLVELVTQQRRCQDGRSSHQVERILHSDLELPVEMDTELLRIVRQCLEKTPSRRTATALQFAEQIESWLANHPTDSAESPFPRKYRILFAIACAVVIGVLVLNVLFRQ